MTQELNTFIIKFKENILQVQGMKHNENNIKDTAWLNAPDKIP